MNHLILSANFVSLLTFILGLSTILKGSRNEVNLTFALYSWSITLWSLCFAKLHTVPPEWAIWWGRFLHLGCTFIPVLFLHFAWVLSGLKKNEWKITIVYAIALGYNLLNLIPGVFTGEIVYRSGYAYPRPIGLIYFSYLLFFVTLVVSGLVMLYKMLPRLPQGEARWLRMFIILTLCGYLGGMNNFLIMIDVRLFPLFPYGLYAIVLYCVAVGYLINRYSLLEMHFQNT